MPAFVTEMSASKPSAFRTQPSVFVLSHTITSISGPVTWKREYTVHTLCLLAFHRCPLSSPSSRYDFWKDTSDASHRLALFHTRL